MKLFDVKLYTPYALVKSNLTFAEAKKLARLVNGSIVIHINVNEEIKDIYKVGKKKISKGNKQPYKHHTKGKRKV